MNTKAIIIGACLGILLSLASYSNAYFVDYTYQDNIIKIEVPPIEEPKHTFETVADIDGDTFNNIKLYMNGHINVDSKFFFDINNKYGVFENKLFISVNNASNQSINIRLTRGDDFKLSDFDTEFPTNNKLDVTITYREDNQIYKKDYTIEFIRDDDNPKTLKVYFYEIN